MEICHCLNFHSENFYSQIWPLCKICGGFMTIKNDFCTELFFSKTLNWWMIWWMWWSFSLSILALTIPSLLGHWWLTGTTELTHAAITIKYVPLCTSTLVWPFNIVAFAFTSANICIFLTFINVVAPVVFVRIGLVAWLTDTPERYKAVFVKQLYATVCTVKHSPAF